MVASEAEDDVQKNSPPATENNEETAPTKRFYRMEVWTVIKPLFPQGSALSRYVNKKIPLFPDAEQTAERLAETPEFKDAKNIKVNIDMAQESVKLQVLKANKTLFVAPSQKSDYLYAKIKLPGSLEEVPLVQQRRIVKMLAGEDTYEELGIDQSEPLDMVVVGCVAVSERGQRIGKGNGYVDLEIGILQSLGVITPKTVIATTVADEQVYKELPAELFQNYDFTVDLIVTPTRVIRVDPRPDPRAIGVQWGLLSSRRLDVVRVLKKLKERLEKEGQQIELKDEDTDVESFAKRRTRGNDGGGGGGDGQQERRRQHNRRRRSTRNSNADGHNEMKSGNERDGTAEGNGEGGSRMRRNRRYFRKPHASNHRYTAGGSPDDDEAGGGYQSRQRPRKGGRPKPRPDKTRYDDEFDVPNGPSSYAARERERQQKQTSLKQKPQLRDSVRIRVSNMFSVPFKEFKQELRNRDCYPAKISQIRNGLCVLIFPKREDKEEQEQADELLQKLAEMCISVPQKNSNELKQIKLKCELQQKPKGFIDTNVMSITAAAKRAAKRANDACTKLANAADDTNAHGNVAELVAEVQAAALLAARTAKAAGTLTEKVLEQAKPAIEAENDKEDSKLRVHAEIVAKAGTDALAAATKAEEAAATLEPTAKTEPTDATNVEASTAVKVEANDAPKVETNNVVKVEVKDELKMETTDETKAEEATAASTTTVAQSPPSKEAVAAVNSTVQEAARATAAVSFAIATLYELAPPAQPTVTGTSVQTLTHLFGSLLSEVSS